MRRLALLVLFILLGAYVGGTTLLQISGVVVSLAWRGHADDMENQAGQQENLQLVWPFLCVAVGGAAGLGVFELSTAAILKNQNPRPTAPHTAMMPTRLYVVTAVSRARVTSSDIVT